MNTKNSKTNTISVIKDKVCDISSKPLFIFTAGFTLGYATKYLIDKTQKLMFEKLMKKVFKK